MLLAALDFGVWAIDFVKRTYCIELLWIFIILKEMAELRV